MTQSVRRLSAVTKEAGAGNEKVDARRAKFYLNHTQGKFIHDDILLIFVLIFYHIGIDVYIIYCVLRSCVLYFNVDYFDHQ